MKKLILLVTVMATFGAIGKAQQVPVDSKADRLTSYQMGSRMVETSPVKSDLIKAQFAKRLNERLSNDIKMKGAVDHPAIGANFKNYLPSNTGSNGISDVFVRFVEEDSKGNLYFSSSGIDMWDGFGWENFNTSNSELPNVTVHDMLEDRMGNLWFATFSGLVRYDVQSDQMHVIHVDEGLRSPLVLRLHEDAVGNIYAGHRWDDTFGGGITVLNTYGNVIGTISGDDGLYGDSIEDFAENKGKLYVATGADPETGDYGGVNVLDLESSSIDTVFEYNTTDLPFNEVSSLAIDHDGNVWAGFYLNGTIGHTEGGVAMYDGSSWTHYSQDNGDDVGHAIRDLLVDSDGTLWMGADDGVFTYDGLTFNQVLQDDDNGFALSNVGSVSELSDGRIAISKFPVRQQGGGVSIWNPADDTWQHLSSRDGGTLSKVQFGADYDSKGNLWTTGFYGLQKFDGETWTTWTEKDGLPYSYGWDLIVDSNDNVWINSADTALTRINADGTIDIIDEYGSFVESNYEASNGDMWFGDYWGDYDSDGDYESNGVLHFNGTNYTVYDSTDGLPARQQGAVTSIAEDQAGRILAATSVGLYRLENGSFTEWEFDGISGAYVYKLHFDSQNRLWINYLNGGPSTTAMFDGSEWVHFSQFDGVRYTEDIEEDMSGRVWLAQSDGAVVYDNGTIHHVSPKNGYTNLGMVYDLAPSRTDAGVMTFGTYGGGVLTMDTELPLSITEASDYPEDQGGWIRLAVDGYLLSPNYTGDPAAVWRVEVDMDGTWEAANAPISAASVNTVSVQVPVTKATDTTPDEGNSFDFRVVALNDEGDVVGVSETVNAYAEDNIAPAQVMSVEAEKAEGTISLNWNQVEDNDVAGYAVYESSVTDFAETAPIAFTSSLSLEIEDEEYSELVVVAKDRNNNYGTPSEVVVITSMENRAGLPEEFELKQNYPNPFNPSTKISYALPQNSHVKITVFNAIGQQVGVLLNEAKAAGRHEVSFNAEQLNSGMYIYRIEAGSFTHTRKMMLIK